MYYYRAQIQFIYEWKGEVYAKCTFCSSDFSISHGGKSDCVGHISTNKHKDSAKAVSASKLVKPWK